MEPTRREVLSTAVGIAGLGSLAGCLGDSQTGASTTTAQATFFVFGDIASEVAGDTAETDLLVPVGQHGHGWEPGPRVREDIYDSQLLLHGMDGFQPWVDDIRGDLEADGTDVETLDVSDGVDLLEAGAEHDHTEAVGHEDHDDGIENGDHDSETEHHDGEHTADGHEDDGHHESHTEDGHDDGNRVDHDTADTHDDEHDHGHDNEANADPHFWTDPLRVKQAVTNVQQGLADVSEANTETYTENADSYASELDELHEQLQTLREAATKDVLLIAGHDSFQYFGDCYNVEIQALTDVSPDDRPTTRDIERAQDIIETHGLQYICADPLESQEAAEQLVAETDAEAVLPLTAMPGLKDEWDENDWGYLDVMENVNIPTLKEALDA